MKTQNDTGIMKEYDINSSNDNKNKNKMPREMAQPATIRICI
jgi:hypothetical protein